MAIELGKPKRKLPKAKDFYPSKSERREVTEEYDRTNGNTHTGSSFYLWLIILSTIASFVSAIVATYYMGEENQGVWLIIVEIYAPMIITWFVHLNGEMVEGFYFTIPGILIGGTFFVITGTMSCLWIALAAGFSLLAFIAMLLLAEFS